MFPLSKSIRCCICNTKYYVFVLFGSPKKLNYIITTFKRRPIMIAEVN